MASDVLGDRFKAGKAYTPTQAARLAGTTAATVRRWIEGYEAQGHKMEPVFGTPRARRTAEPLALSFIDLIELVVAVRFRQAAVGNLRLERIRRAYEYVQDVLGVSRPFASTKLKIAGGHVIHEFEIANEPMGLAISAHGQWVLPGLVQDALAVFDYDEADLLVRRWWPAGRNHDLVVDPRFGGGRVTIPDTGVTAEAIFRRRCLANESVRQIARDLGVPAHAVVDVERYYSKLAA